MKPKRRNAAWAGVILAACCALLPADAEAFEIKIPLPGGGKKDSGGDLDDVRKGLEIIRKVAHAVEATNLTAEQEHYVGRAVAARILQRYDPYENEAATRYVNLVGQAVARASMRPETFGGYRFLILDSDEVNGFAAPGGFVFVTRGLLRCCPDEDALAAVLAHEVAHVGHKHGLRSIRSKRLTPIATELLGEAFGDMDDGELGKVTEIFGGSVDDVLDPLINSKYSRATEVKADEGAVETLRAIGYDPRAFLRVLERMDAYFEDHRGGFMDTHPTPKWRIRWLRKRIPEADEARPAAPEARQARFDAAMKGV